MIVNSDLTQLIYFSLTELQKLQNTFTIRAKVNWNIPAWGLPHLSTKKEAGERFVTRQKPNLMMTFCEQEHQWHCYQLHCMCFSKGKASLCSMPVYPLYIPRFAVFSLLQRHLQIENLRPIFCISLNNTVASSMLKPIKFSEIFHIHFNP